MVKFPTIKKILWCLLFTAAWIALSWFLRRTIGQVLGQMFEIDPMYDGAKTTLSGWGIFALYLSRLALFFLLGVTGIGVKYLLKTCSAGSLVPSRYRKMDRDSRHPDKSPELARVLFFFVVFLSIMPASWPSYRLLEGIALFLIAVTMFGIQLVAGIGMGESIGPIVKLDRQKQPQGTYFFAAVVFAFYILFVCFHLPYYAVAVCVKTLTFAVARHRLLMLHALAMWGALPLYVLGTHDLKIIFNFVKLNFWFLPMPKFLKTSEEFSGGLSGGAGATRAFPK